jgi:hypothetical protein
MSPQCCGFVGHRGLIEFVGHKGLMLMMEGIKVF